MKKLIPDSKIAPHIYQLQQKPVKKWLLLILLPFLLGLILNFSFEPFLRNMIKSKLRQLPCRFTYQDFQIHYLFPSIVFEQVLIPPSCLSEQVFQQSLPFHQLKISFRGLGLFPFGLKFGLFTSSTLGEMSLYLTQGPKSLYLKLEDSHILLEQLSKYTRSLKLEGPMLFDLFFILKSSSQLDHLEGTISSSNIHLPSQSLSGLLLPSMAFHQLRLIIESNEQNPTFLNVDLGNKSSPVQLSIQGPIKINGHQLSQSSLHLKGQAYFAPNFLNEFAIIKLLLQKYPSKNGRYSYQISGTLDTPRLHP
jgi:hypothetical protein